MLEAALTRRERQEPIQIREFIMSRIYRVRPMLVSVAILSVAIVVGTSLVRAGGDGQTSALTTYDWPQNSKTADPTAALLQRVEALERRVAALEGASHSAIGPGSSRFPESSGSFEFNGQTIYIVPTATSSSMQGLSEGPGPTWQPSLNQTLLKYQPLPNSRR
jgi:hypothetical protein